MLWWNYTEYVNFANINGKPIQFYALLCLLEANRTYWQRVAVKSISVFWWTRPKTYTIRYCAQKTLRHAREPSCTLRKSHIASCSTLKWQLALIIFTDGWWSSNDIHETTNYCYDQIWEMTIVLKLSYDLPHEPVPKLMSSRDIVPIRDKLATGLRHQTLCECSRTIRDKVQSFLYAIPYNL